MPKPGRAATQSKVAILSQLPSIFSNDRSKYTVEQHCCFCSTLPPKKCILSPMGPLPQV